MIILDYLLRWKNEEREKENGSVTTKKNNRKTDMHPEKVVLKCYQNCKHKSKPK